MLVGAIAAAAFARVNPVTVIALFLVGVQVLLQCYWLLPTLDTRVSQLLSGNAPGFSIHHRIYAAMEALKSALLIVAAVIEYRSAVQ